MSATDATRATWSYNYEPVPGHEGWSFHIGLGGPCWCVALDRDSYTFAQLDRDGFLSMRNVPADVVRWLLDNHPPLDSWVAPTKEQLQAAWDSSRR